MAIFLCIQNCPNQFWMFWHVSRSFLKNIFIYISSPFLLTFSFSFYAGFSFLFQRALPSFSFPAARPSPPGPRLPRSPACFPAKWYGGGIPAIDPDRVARTPRLSTSSLSSSHAGEKHRRRRLSTWPEGLSPYKSSVQGLPAEP